MFAHEQPVEEDGSAPKFAAPCPGQEAGAGEEDFADIRLKDFIQHARRCPVRIRKLPPWQRWRYRNEALANCHTGLVVHSAQYLAPGALLELIIPTRQQQQSFIGKVVLVRALEEGFDLGIRFLLEQDAQRIRMVEQICRIELYLCDKKRSDGPFVSHETLTQEWIGKFAARFPRPRL